MDGGTVSLHPLISDSKKEGFPFCQGQWWHPSANEQAGV